MAGESGGDTGGDTPRSREHAMAPAASGVGDATAKGGAAGSGAAGGRRCGRGSAGGQQAPSAERAARAHRGVRLRRGTCAAACGDVRQAIRPRPLLRRADQQRAPAERARGRAAPGRERARALAARAADGAGRLRHGGVHRAQGQPQGGRPTGHATGHATHARCPMPRASSRRVSARPRAPPRRSWTSSRAPCRRSRTRTTLATASSSSWRTCAQGRLAPPPQPASVPRHRCSRPTPRACPWQTQTECVAYKRDADYPVDPALQAECSLCKRWLTVPDVPARRRDHCLSTFSCATLGARAGPRVPRWPRWHGRKPLAAVAG